MKCVVFVEVGGNVRIECQKQGRGYDMQVSCGTLCSLKYLVVPLRYRKVGLRESGLQGP